MPFLSFLLKYTRSELIRTVHTVLTIILYMLPDQMKRLVKDLYIRDNCHPMKTMLVAWLQLPMWFSLSFALRNMAGALPIRGGNYEDLFFSW